MIVMLLAGYVAQAGNITILINPSQGMPKQFKLYLTQYISGNISITDSAIVTTVPYTNALNIKANEASLCMLQIARETNKAEFIYNPSEDIVIVTDYWQLKNGTIAINNSIENNAYGELLKAKGSRDLRIEDLEMRLKAVSLFATNYWQRIMALEDTLWRIADSINSDLNTIAKRYPNTYTATTLVPIAILPLRSKTNASEQYETYLAYFNKYYFTEVAKAKGNALNHYAYEDKLATYLDRYTEKNTDGAEQGIDVIMAALPAEHELRNYTYNILLKTFLNFKTETLARYLINKYSDGCSVNLSIEDLKKLTKMQALSVGGIVPEISLPDAMGKQQSLKNYLGSNKYTIIYFWVSWCAHCQKETPKLQALYQQYKKKGLGVYAVSLDEKKEDWTTALQKYNTGWMNVCETVPVKNSTYAPAFNVTTTPKIYIVDKAGKVVAKDVYGAKLEESIQSLMK